MKIGDKVIHKKANITGYVKRIHDDIITIERRDLPKRKNIHGYNEWESNVCDIKNLILV